MSTESEFEREEPLGEGHRPGGEKRSIVEADGEVWLRKLAVEPGCQHVARPDHHLLGGLADKDKGPAPRVLMPREHPGRADENGHVDVVAAGMHDGHVGAGKVQGADRARVGKARLLLDGKGVHVGSDEERRARAVPQDPDDARPAELLGDLKPGRAQLLGHPRRRLLLLERELRMGVEVLIESFERGVLGGDRRCDGVGHGRSRAGHEDRNGKRGSKNRTQGKDQHPPTNTQRPASSRTSLRPSGRARGQAWSRRREVPCS